MRVCTVCHLHNLLSYNNTCSNFRRSFGCDLSLSAKTDFLKQENNKQTNSPKVRLIWDFLSAF